MKGIMVVAVVMMMSLVLKSEGAVHVVGGRRGWNPGAISAFPFYKGTIIHAGDVLEFKYDNTKHNVAQVDENGFANCEATSGYQIWTSGDDRIKLAGGAGTYNFISTYPHDCKRNAMRFSVYAS